MSPAEMRDHALAIDLELARIETTCLSVAERETELRDLVSVYPRAAVAAIARLRGFRNLARIAARVAA